MYSNALRYATVVAFGGLVFGLDAALISGTIGFVTSEFDLNDFQVGTVVSASGFGVLFALLLVGYLADRLGRKRTLQFIAGLYLFSAISSALAPSYEALIAARFLGGLAFTSITLASMYIGEIAPPDKRGKLVAMNQINIVVGLSAAYFINYLILQISQSQASWVSSWGIDTYTWRWMLGAEVIPAILWSILLLFIPCSPRWLLLKGREKEAKAVLAKIFPKDQLEEAFADMQESLSKESVHLTFGEQFKRLFNGNFRLAIVVAVTYAVVQQITGINAVLFYAPTVFEQLGLGTDSAFAQAVWVGLAGLFFTVVALALIDKVGRRPLTLWGLLWVILSLGICSYGFHHASYTLDQSDVAMVENLETEAVEAMLGISYDSDVQFKAALREYLGDSKAKAMEGTLFNRAAKLPSTLILFGIISFVAAFHFSIGPIMWIIFSEIFPTSVRAVAIPAFALVTSVVSYLVQQFFPWQLTNMGARDIFLFYAATGAIGLAILWRFLPETKNKTLEEIEASWR
ncbi:MAG: MFS transporter [Bacteroidota bacterium]